MYHPNFYGGNGIVGAQVGKKKMGRAGGREGGKKGRV